MTKIDLDKATIADVCHIITEITTARQVWTFNPTRYPYTYAYDYMRSHGSEFKLYGMFRIDEGLSWGECATRLRNNPDKLLIVERCADAYLVEHNINMHCGECGEDYRDTEDGCDSCELMKIP